MAILFLLPVSKLKTMRSIFLLLALMPLLATATIKDTTKVYYVLQNPKFYGLENARAWFEIHGLKNSLAEQKINDTLRKIFNEKTLFTEGGFGATLQDDQAPKGYKDYYFNNGHTYGEGYVRFKESDSLLRITEADGYYGAGMNLEGFNTRIAEEKMLWIQISRAQNFSNSGDYFFSLTTGEVMPPKFYVLLAPEKKDSLSKLLYAMAMKKAKDEYPFKSFEITDIPLSDSIEISSVNLIQWFTGWPNAAGVYQNYPYNAEHDFMTTVPSRMYVQLNFDESMNFFVAGTKEKLQKIYEK